jgi:hypothetical protein
MRRLSGTDTLMLYAESAEHHRAGGHLRRVDGPR